LQKLRISAGKMQVLGGCQIRWQSTDSTWQDTSYVYQAIGLHG